MLVITMRNGERHEFEGAVDIDKFKADVKKCDLVTIRTAGKVVTIETYRIISIEYEED
ncbi:MAG: hypothetical protein RR782_02560 [Clostridium sp.]